MSNPSIGHVFACVAATVARPPAGTARALDVSKPDGACEWVTHEDTYYQDLE